MLHRFALGLLAVGVAPTALGSSPVRAGGAEGLVFTMSNSAEQNRVLTWSRAADGSLAFVGRTATGGHGTGGALNSQGGLALSANGRWLGGKGNIRGFRRGTGGKLSFVTGSGRPLSATNALGLVAR